MTAHLLLVTLGPVQDFIAQARRTRDLWYGSHLLSELGRAAARALVERNAELIFPAVTTGDGQLEACLAPLRPNGQPPLNIANKLLAGVPAGVDPKQLAREVRAAVMRYWREDIAARVRAKCAGVLAENIDAIWNEQIDTFVEFAAGWAPLDDYANTRRQVEAAVAGRKLLRDFVPWIHGRGSVPKSSLDGARETVLRPKNERDKKLVSRYRILEDENLDAIGLIKRVGGDPNQFAPVINVAFASWVELANRVAASELGQLKRACEMIRISHIARADLPCVEPFPFDASVLLASRWRAMFKEQELAGDAEAWGRQYVQPVFEKVPEPFPYVACIVADGDHMGRAIDRLSSSTEHRTFSDALARFAGEARNVIEQHHRGVLVYAGGDDVLAFLPVPEALVCAEELRVRFTDLMVAACFSLPSEHRPTLSVGVGIGHVMESMGDLLGLGRAAEREAKRDRNALAVLIDKRSGGRRSWRARWSDDPSRRLRESVELLQARLPARKVYEIASTLARLPKPHDVDGDAWARLTALEVRRSLARIEEGRLTPEDTGLVLDGHAGYADLHAGVSAWVDRLLIARTFAQAEPRRGHDKEEA